MITLTEEQAQQIEVTITLSLGYFPETVDGGVAIERAKKSLAAVRAVRAQEQAEQEPVPTGATHYQPHQKTYYKRVSATEWYLWSCTGKGWLPSKGTSDSSEWIMLSPIQAYQPAKQAEQEPVAWRWPTHNGYAYAETHFDDEGGEPLYAAPVRTKDLTADELAGACGWKLGDPMYEWVVDIGRWAIAADREKNK